MLVPSPLAVVVGLENISVLGLADWRCRLQITWIYFSVESLPVPSEQTNPRLAASIGHPKWMAIHQVQCDRPAQADGGCSRPVACWPHCHHRRARCPCDVSSFLLLATNALVPGSDAPCYWKFDTLPLDSAVARSPGLLRRPARVEKPWWRYVS